MNSICIPVAPNVFPVSTYRTYLLLRVMENKAEAVVNALRNKPGILMADSMETSRDVFIVVEAPERTKLAELTNEALGQIEFIEDVRLLPVYRK